MGEFVDTNNARVEWFEAGMHASRTDMDTVDMDPEMAQGFVKLLNTKLKETKKALEDAKTENRSLREVIRKYEAGENGLGRDQQQTLQAKTLRNELEDARALLGEYDRKLESSQIANTLLQTEINKLRCELELRENTNDVEMQRDGKGTSRPSSAASSTLASETDASPVESGKQAGETAEQQSSVHQSQRQTPCVGVGRNPMTIPKAIKQMATAKTGVLYWPGRTTFPYEDPTGIDARINVCLAKCVTTTDPFCWIPTSYNLAQFVGTRRELFHHVLNVGTCYLGTYRCERAGVYTSEEFSKFPASMIDNIVQQSFSQPARYKWSSASDKNAVRNAYLSGKAQVQYLHLEFESFNQQYFDALMKLKEDDDRAQTEKQDKRKQTAEAEKQLKTKRHCGGIAALI